MNNEMFVCSICHQRAWGHGYFQPKGKNKYYCLACGPELAQGMYHMTREQIDESERKAMVAALPRIGDYLDKVGKTDFTQFTNEEFDAFLREVIVSFGEAMRGDIT